MRIIVFSDSNGETAGLLTAVEEERPDAIFFLGDGARDAEDLHYAFPDIPMYQVPGNCDWMLHDLPHRRLVPLDGVRFFLCHGHTYGVKSGLSTAVSRARSEGADVLLYGHTHVPDFQLFGELQVFNPGSVRDTRTYGMILTQRGCASCSIRHITGT